MDDALTPYFNLVAGLFGLIPEALWVGILTAGGALIAVKIQNATHTKNLAIHLDREAAEKEKDRKISYRKEVYLNYVAECHKAFAYIGTLPHQNLAKGNPLNEISDFGAAISRLSLIVPDETAGLLADLNKKLAIFLLDTIKMMGPIADVQSAIDNVLANENSSIREQQRVNTEQLYINEAGIRDDVRFYALQRTFEWHGTRLDEISKERNSLTSKKQKLAHNLMKFIMVSLAPIGDIHFKICLNLRRDLGIESDNSALRLIMESHREEILSKVNGIIEQNYSEMAD